MDKYMRSDHNGKISKLEKGFLGNNVFTLWIPSGTKNPKLINLIFKLSGIIRKMPIEQAFVVRNEFQNYLYRTYPSHNFHLITFSPGILVRNGIHSSI